MASEQQSQARMTAKMKPGTAEKNIYKKKVRFGYQKEWLLNSFSIYTTQNMSVKCCPSFTFLSQNVYTYTTLYKCAQQLQQKLLIELDWSHAKIP